MILQTPAIRVESSLKKRLTHVLAILFAFTFPSVAAGVREASTILHEPGRQRVTLSDGQRHLTLRLSYGQGCFLDRVHVRGRDVLSEAGVSTGVRIREEWFTTKSAAGAKVRVGKNTVTVTDISYGKPGQEIHETWKFTTRPDQILWQIKRKYSADVTVEDMAFPEWNFLNLSTWTGGLLDNGGVVWNKYLDRPNATYGSHFGAVTFWNAASNDCLRIHPDFAPGLVSAGRFSSQKDGAFSFHYGISGAPFKPKHGKNRFLGDRQDLWQPIEVSASEIVAEFVLQALEYDKAYDRGTFAGLDGSNVRELLNTVPRYGVIDSQWVGANGWRSGYVCLHEPFFAQMAAVINDADYTANLATFLDNARDHAILPHGRVKSRWTYGPFDAMPGSYDEFGFYEAQWGYLLDSQTSYVMNVAEQFCLTGDREWLARHKDSCERALAFLTRREIGQSGLVTMMTDSHRQQRGSDWIDIIWASHANAFVNAQLYAALNLWAEAEEALNDSARAENYRAFAGRLKESFNRTTSKGGFWDSTNQWYVYWREADGAVHGNNLVTPVNFAAIAYGLCDEPNRQKAILDRIEAEMKKENLFYWPLNFFPFDPAEGAANNFPFPKYENGDIFLSWGELGVRAYAAHDPALALKYVKNTLTRYAQDGLSFQRYLRADQQGAGDDILAGNCMPVVGLYRNIYGIQPKPNRLCLEPHLPAELSGTTLRYTLRSRLYEIELNGQGAGVSANGCTLRDRHPFGVNATETGLEYFPGTNTAWAMTIAKPRSQPLTIRIENWPIDPALPRHWTESSPEVEGKTAHVITHLLPNATYRLETNGKTIRRLRTDKTGSTEFTYKRGYAAPQKFKLALDSARRS